jgi:hypothetical protein
MGHHRKQKHGQPSPSAAAGPSVPEQARAPRGVADRALEDLAEAARTARRTGWAYGEVVVASADTQRVPTSPAESPLPRRYATHQPTEPFPAARPRRRPTPAA